MATAKESQKSDHKSVAYGKEEDEEDSTLDSKKRERDIADWISRPHKTPFQETRKRKLMAEKKMLVPLKPQQKTTHPSTNTSKVVSSNGKMTAKTPCSCMQKIPRKKLH